MSGIYLYVLDSKLNRRIYTFDEDTIPAGRMLVNILQEYGDVEGEETSNSLILITSRDGLPEVHVNTSLTYRGLYNHYNGELSANAADHALTCFLINQLMLANHQRGYPVEALADRHDELMTKARLELSYEEYAQFRMLLD